MQASSEINSIQVEGLKKLHTVPKIIRNKTILKKVSLIAPELLDVVEIKELVIDPAYQGKGVGSTILTKIAEVADKHKVSLYLEAVPIGNKPLSVHQLVDLYKKFGFGLLVYGKRPIMLRKPNT